jgi:hypothetical protein
MCVFIISYHVNKRTKQPDFLLLSNTGQMIIKVSTKLLYHTVSIALYSLGKRQERPTTKNRNNVVLLMTVTVSILTRPHYLTLSLTSRMKHPEE